MEYAVPADFCQLFHHHLDRLYALSLLLTADQRKAEQCFVSGLEDCLQGNPVFREWAQSWARRTVIKNAIRLIAPLRNETESASGVPKPPGSKHYRCRDHDSAPVRPFCVRFISAGEVSRS